MHAVHVGPPDVLDGPVVLVEHRSEWADQFATEAARIRGALGDRVVVLEHVGSTSVPSLLAKPLLDVLLVVADPDAEAAYVPDLEAAGLVLRIREPLWHRHRLLKGTDPALNLHVFAPDCAEPLRMLRFRDHLRSDAADRELYARTKRELAARTWKYTQHYADAKSTVVEQILARAGAPTPDDTCPSPPQAR